MPRWRTSLIRAALARLWRRLCKALADFHLLLVIGEGLLEMGEGLEEVASCVGSQVSPGRAKLPLEEGYKLMLCSIAGLD